MKKIKTTTKNVKNDKKNSTIKAKTEDNIKVTVNDAKETELNEANQKAFHGQCITSIKLKPTSTEGTTSNEVTSDGTTEQTAMMTSDEETPAESKLENANKSSQSQSPQSNDPNIAVPVQESSKNDKLIENEETMDDETVLGMQRLSPKSKNSRKRRRTESPSNDHAAPTAFKPPSTEGTTVEEVKCDDTTEQIVSIKSEGISPTKSKLEDANTNSESQPPQSANDKLIQNKETLDDETMLGVPKLSPKPINSRKRRQTESLSNDHTERTNWGSEPPAKRTMISQTVSDRFTIPSRKRKARYYPGPVAAAKHRRVADRNENQDTPLSSNRNKTTRGRSRPKALKTIAR